MQTAFALDAAVFDLAYIVGPVLASVLATALAPAASVAVLLVLTATAILIISIRRPHAPARREAPRAPRRPHSPLRSPVLRRLLITAALTNAALSATEVGLTAYVRHHHALWASGPLLAEVSIGSILGSLLLGARVVATKPRQNRLPRLLAGYALGLAVLTGAGLYPPLLAVAAPLAGLCLGPTLATLFGTAAARRPWQRHRDPGLAQLDHERRRRRRGRPRRAFLRPAGPRPRRRRRHRRRGCPQRRRRRTQGGHPLSSWTAERVLAAAAAMEWCTAPTWPSSKAAPPPAPRSCSVPASPTTARTAANGSRFLKMGFALRAALAPGIAE